MKRTILTIFLISTMLAILFYWGGTALLIALGVIGLTSIILVSFFLGAKMAHKMMTEGARLAIASQGQNDKHDAVKIKALAELTREAIKAKNEALPVNGGYPALPPFDTVDGKFTIAGLDEETEQ